MFLYNSSMSDAAHSSMEEVTLTPQEQEDVRARIEEVAAESRIPVTMEVFSLEGVRRGVGLPIAVGGGVLLVVFVGLIILLSVFRQSESVTRAEAGQYVSIEGRLIRELRQESQEQLGEKNQEIEEIRARLSELQDEQIALETDIESRLAQREEELRLQLQADIEAERARLVGEGFANEELAQLLAAFETERRAFYEQRLDEYRAQLDEERQAVQATIDRLRGEYESRLSDLQSERDEILEEFARREAELRTQLQQRTRAAAGVDPAELDAAGEELAALAERVEEERAIESQVIGQIDRVRSAIVAGENQAALDRIGTLRDFLGEERVLAIDSVAARRETDLFLLGQLERLVQTRLEAAEPPAEDQSLIEELELIRRLRELGESESANLDPQDRAALLLDFLNTFSTLGITADQLNAALLSPADEDQEEDGAAAADLLRQLAAEEATSGDLQAALIEFESALDASADREAVLESQVARLSTFEEVVVNARRRYGAYQSAIGAASGAEQASLVARQELDEFLASGAVRVLFSDLNQEINSLFAATQTAGSSAALDDAAAIIEAIMAQPSAAASLNMLRFEKIEAAGNDELLTILESLEDALED